MERVLRAIIKSGIFICLFLPLLAGKGFFVFPFVFPKTVLFQIIIEIVFLLWIILVIRKEERINTSPLSLAILSLVFVLFLTSVFGQNFQKSFFSTQERMSGIFTLSHFLGFFLMLSVFKKEKEWENLFKISVACSFLVSISALYQKINPSFLGPMPNANIYGTTGNSIMLSVYLIFNIFLSLFLYLKEENKKDKKWWLIILVVNLISFFFARSASAYLAILAGIFIIIFFKIIKIDFRKRRNAIVAAGLAIAFLCVLIYGGFAFSTKANSLIERFSAWKMGLMAFLEKPLSGFGWENFNLIYNKFYNPASFSGVIPDFYNAHNNFVDFLSLSGIFGFINYIVLVIFAVIAARRIGKPYIFLALIISYFAAIFFNFDTFLSWLMLFLVLGFLARKKDEITDQKQNIRRFSFKYLLMLIPLIITIASLNLNIQSALANFYARKALKSSSPEIIINNFKKSEKCINFEKISLRTEVANFLARISKENTPKDSSDIYKFLEPLLKDNFRIDQKNQNNYLTLGILYRNWGEIDESKFNLASETFQAAITENPKKQGFYFLAAQTKILEEKYEEAVFLAKKGVEIYDKSPQSHLFLAIAHLFSNDENNFKRELERFKELKNFKENSKKSPVQKILTNEVSYTAEYYIDIFDVYLKTKNWEKIIKLADEISDFETDPYLHQYIAGLYLDLGYPEKAKEENAWIENNYPELKRSTSNFLKSMEMEK